MSLVVFEDGGRVQKILLQEALSRLQDRLISARLWNAHGAWPMYSKFFDHPHPLGLHVHHRDQHARLVGQLGKPEAYYFPPQHNMTSGEFPHTFFGIEPGTSKEDLANASPILARVITRSRVFPRRIGCCRGRGGMCRREYCTRRGVSAPMSRNGRAMCLRFISR